MLKDSISFFTTFIGFFAEHCNDLVNNLTHFESNITVITSNMYVYSAACLFRASLYREPPLFSVPLCPPKELCSLHISQHLLLDLALLG